MILPDEPGLYQLFLQLNQPLRIAFSLSDPRDIGFLVCGPGEMVVEPAEVALHLAVGEHRQDERRVPLHEGAGGAAGLPRQFEPLQVERQDRHAETNFAQLNRSTTPIRRPLARPLLCVCEGNPR